MPLFFSLLSSHKLIIKNLVWYRHCPHSPSQPWGDSMGCQMDAVEDKTRWNSEAPESIHRLTNAGLTRCSHGNMRMSSALSTFREAQWGTACKLCDAHSTSAYACTVWQAGRAYLWIITTDIDHIRGTYCMGYCGHWESESLFWWDILTTTKLNRAKNNFINKRPVIDDVRGRCFDGLACKAVRWL